MIEASATRKDFDAAHPQRRVDHRALVPAHAARSDRVIDGVGALADELAQSLRIVAAAAVNVLAAVTRERGLGQNPLNDLGPANQRLEVVRVGQEIRIDDRRGRDVRAGEPDAPRLFGRKPQTCSDMPFAKWSLRP